MPKSGYKSVKWLFGKEMEIPEEWEILRVNDFATVHGRIGWKNLRADEYVESGPLMLSVWSLIDSIPYGIDYDVGVKRLSEFRYEESPEIQIENGDVLVAKDGDIGRIGYVKTLPERSTVNSHVVVVRNKNENVFSEFLYYFMKFHPFQAYCKSYTSGTTVPLLTQKDLRNGRIIIPLKQEQQKIASILSSLDELISSYDDTIQTTKKLKKGLMQTLLTKGIGHTKFKKKYFGFGKEIQFPEEWRIEKLKENSSKIGSGVTPLGGSEVYLTKGIPLIRSQNIHFDGLHLDNVVYITEQIHDKMKNSKLKPNDILLNITGASIGRCTIFPDNLGEANVNQHVCIIRSKSSLLPSFLNYFMASSLMQNIINSVQVGLSRQGLNFKDLGNFLIPIPNSNEQQKIASILSSVDEKISELESKKKSLESLKKGLMQKLLTGNIRVSV